MYQSESFPVVKGSMSFLGGCRQHTRQHGIEPRALSTCESPAPGAQHSHMHLHQTSAKQQRAAAHFPLARRCMPAQLDLSEGLWADGICGAGRSSQFGVRSHTHEAKKAIVAEMWELNRPVTSKELYARLDRAWSLKAIEYHLSTLVKTKVVEVVFGPELHFSLTDGGGET
jgi:hypothetical protein